MSRFESIEAQVLEGAPVPALEHLHLADALRATARRNPTRGIGCQDLAGSRRRSYPGQLAAAAVFAGRLREAGVRARQPVLLGELPNHALIDAFWGCQLADAVPVVLPPGAGQPAGRHSVAVDGAEPVVLAHPGRPPFELAGLGRAAVVCFTAGRRRPIALSHEQILARARGTSAHNGWDASERTYNFLPLRHVSGLLMFHVRDLLAGAEQRHDLPGPVLAEPLTLLARLAETRATLAWLTPPLLRALADRLAVAGAPGPVPDLRTLMLGGDRVVAADLHRVERHAGLGPGVIVAGYGLTEAGSGIVSATGPAPEAGIVPVGRPEPGSTVRVVPEPGRSLGAVQVTGVACGSPHAWFDTGDVGLVADGALTVLGSRADVLLGPDRAWHAAELEELLADLGWPRPGEVVAVPDPAGVRLHLHPANLAAPAAARAAALVEERTGLRVAGLCPLPAGGVPRAGHGKPLRSQLAGTGEAG
ncbi:MAG TPA: AMP-binding protein [Jatrophihabitans sp.]|nr:AMP-binding protein [Jatrophihabitans sp.]